MPVNLNYQENSPPHPFGSAVIIVHDVFSSLSEWTPIVENLSETFKVISVDLRNHGDSPHEDSMTYQEMADDLKQLMATLSIKQASFIGHGMGGKAVMTLALLHPECIKHLIIVDTAPTPYPDYQSLKLDAMTELELEAIADRQDAEDAMARLMPDPAVLKPLLENLQSENGHFKWRINLNVLQQSMDDINSFPSDLPVSSGNYATLFVVGDDSEYFQPEHAKAVKAFFPAAHIVNFSNTGHNLHLDKTTQVADMLADYISRA